MGRLGRFFAASVWGLGALGGAAVGAASATPNVLVLSIDTLRADRLSAYGHGRPTSPRLDALMAEGVRFANARTPEPLTAPALVSLMTSLHPHEHAATRNGLRMRADLPSWPRLLKRRGYETAAFTGNWTLRDEISGLGEHFETYETVLERRRWFGFVKGEATAEDLNGPALQWLDEHLGGAGDRPFFLWIHYVEPHAPYKLHPEEAERLGLGPSRTASDRYDTEVAFVDRRLGQALDAVRQRVDPEELLVVFLSDHGESLGEHDYWGHGRHLYEPTLHVPMAMVWPGTLPAGVVVEEPASLLDVAPTALALLGQEVPAYFQGFDWAGVLLRGEAADPLRATFHQAHRGAVQGRNSPTRVRQVGLLEVGVVSGGGKEILRVGGPKRWLFDLNADPGELRSTVDDRSQVSEELAAWLGVVEEGLARSDDLPPPTLTDEDLEALAALGYLDG